MELTGKCLVKFEEYFIDRYDRNDTSEVIMLYTEFVNIPDSAKFGIYEDFFDYNDVHICIVLSEVSASDSKGVRYDWIVYCDDKLTESDEILGYLERNEARTAAIEKANQIFNER